MAKDKKKKSKTGIVTLETVTPHTAKRMSEIWHILLQDQGRFMSFGAFHLLGEDRKTDYGRIEFIIHEGSTPVGVAWIERHHHADTADIGLGVLPQHRRKGIGRFAARALLRYSFEKLGVHRCESTVVSGNEASLAMHKGGMHEEGRQRSAVKVGGQFYDRVLFGLLRDDWQQQVGERSSKAFKG